MDEKLYADLAAATKYYLIGTEFEERIQEENKKSKSSLLLPKRDIFPRHLPSTRLIPLV